MPTYEYQCSNCGHQLEAFQKMSDEPLRDCPNCNQATLNKLVSATNFQLKGTGWYVTDIRDKGKPKPDAANDASKVSGEAGKTDSTKSTTDKTSTESKGGSSTDSGTTTK